MWHNILHSWRKSFTRLMILIHTHCAYAKLFSILGKCAIWDTAGLSRTSGLGTLNARPWRLPCTAVPELETWAKYQTRKAENWELGSVCSCSATQRSMAVRCFRLISLPACTALQLSGCIFPWLYYEKVGSWQRHQYSMHDHELNVQPCDCVSRGHCYTSRILPAGFVFRLNFLAWFSVLF